MQIFEQKSDLAKYFVNWARPGFNMTQQKLGAFLEIKVVKQNFRNCHTEN